LGHSTYYIAHGVKPLLPFDLAEAMYMVPPQSTMMTTELVALQAYQLQKRPEDLDTIQDQVIKAYFTSIHQFEKKYTHMICTYQFTPGDLVLVQNSHAEASLDQKTKPRWIGHMVIVCQTAHGAYISTEMDGAVSRLRFATFHAILYYA
jgi:phosphoenolpyruvate-protein kinase (PTS system EI component)